MARIELPQSRLRARRRRRRLIGAGLIAGAVLAVCVAIVLFLNAPFLEVKTIEVSGASAVSTSTVESEVRGILSGRYLWILPHDDIFIYPNKAITAQLLNEHPEFSAVAVHAVDFHTLAVTVIERQPVALWCPQQGSDPCDFMDENGIAYAPAPQGSDQVFVTYQGSTTPSARSGQTGVPRQYLTQDSFRSLAALVGALSAIDATNTVRQVVVDGNGDARAYFQDDFLLIFALSDAGGDVFERFGLALKSDPFKGHTLGDFEYLDLRWGDKLYYKLK